MLITAIAPVWAQGSFIPIAVGDNKTGTLTGENPVARFALAVTQPQGVSLRVFAITPGFAPSLALLSTEGVVIAGNNNPAIATAIETSTNTLNVGAYIIEVSSANGQLGDFLLNVEGVEVEPPIALPIGQLVTNSVSSGTPRRAFAFSGSPAGSLVLIVQSQLPNSGSNFLLTDADTGESVASSSARIRGGRYLIPTGGENYIAEITFAGAPIPEGFQICLAPETNLAVCPFAGAPIVATQIPPTDVPQPTLPPTQLPPLPISSVCILASATGGPVNIRSGPGTNYNIVGQLNSTSIANVIARLPDNSWQQVNVNGLVGWMSTSVVRFGGPCQTVPFVTLTPTPTVTLTATATSTGATATATATATSTSPVPLPTLNFSLPPVFGSTALTSGFVPDPFTVGITAGGPASASYLGGGCYGYTTSAPSFSVNYTSGAFPTLRFYFIGSGDTTMIINSPSGSYFCNDDSFGTLNPTLDFNSPQSGRYDIWVATYASGGSVGGTLYVTENTGNHP